MSRAGRREEGRTFGDSEAILMPEARDVRRFHPRRELGRTGFKATILGIGDLADRKVPLAQCVATVRRALDAGLNLIDTAPGYESGYSEQIVGQALKGRRDGVFVIDKIDHHDQPVAPQVEESLGRLEMSHTDAFVFHGLSRMDAWEKLAAPGGGMEQLGQCRSKGQTRFCGISSHDPDVLRAAIESGLCDVVLFPIGPHVDPRYVKQTLPLARARGVGTVCFKTFGAGKLLGDTEGYSRPLAARPRGKLSSGGQAPAGAPQLPCLSADECVRYTLTCDPDVALLGLSFPNEQDAAFGAALGFRPMSEAEMAGARRRAAEAVQHKGRCWWNPGG
jgi:aryl-alcohol dehydrogenase-like predicted oxidoreductase